MGRSGWRSFARIHVCQVLCGLLLLQASPAFTDSGTTGTATRNRREWVRLADSARLPAASAPRFATAVAAAEPAAAPAAPRLASLAPAEPRQARPALVSAVPQSPVFPRDGNGPIANDP